MTSSTLISVITSFFPYLHTLFSFCIGLFLGSSFAFAFWRSVDHD